MAADISPLLAEALNRHRAAAIDLGAAEPPWTVAAVAPREQRLFHWDPWVRSYLIAQELMRPLDFERIPATDDKPEGLRLTVRRIRGGRLVGDPLPLVTMIPPGPAIFERQLRRVLDWAELREERLPEILVQADNPWAFWGTLVPLQTDRMRATRELLEAAVRLAVFVEMRFKHELACWRPVDYSPHVQPVITTPGHGSLPSGHCTESYVVYEVLKALLNSRQNTDGARLLNRQMRFIAERVSMNRVVAGVHFPVDNVAGRMLGLAIGEYLVHRCLPRKYGWHSAGFDGTAFDPDGEFDPGDDEQDLFRNAGPGNVYTEWKDGPDQLDEARDDETGNDLLFPLVKRAFDEVQSLGLRFEDPPKAPPATDAKDIPAMTQAARRPPGPWDQATQF